MIEFIKKHRFIFCIVLVSMFRFLLSFKLPCFYISSMQYDDYLMIINANSLFEHNYLGIDYSIRALIKGPIFPFFLFITRLYRIKYTVLLTILYILSLLYFSSSLKNIVKSKKVIFVIYLVLLFNPVTFSQDLFQRLYRNSISIIELLLFLGATIRVLFNDKNKILNNIILGISLILMFLTREDNIWTYPTLLIIFIYPIFKYRKIKNVLISCIPFVLLILSLNIVSLINYKHYGIYTYNEIQKSEFHNTYKKILQIKEDEKKEKISINKSTLYALADNTKTFNFTHEEIDNYYKEVANSNGEIYNGNIIWYLRNMINQKNEFKTGKESEEYYRKLGEEIDKLFKDGTLKKEFIMPSIFMSVPSSKEIKIIPKNVLYTIYYVTTYKEIKTMTDTNGYKYDKNYNAYFFAYNDYHHTVNIVDKNPIQYEIIRNIYKYVSIVLSLIALIVYFRYIFKFDNISIISHILIISYLLIIGGVAYTHTTSFHAIRPIYLGNAYILQTIFILLNVYRLLNIIKEKIKN